MAALPAPERHAHVHPLFRATLNGLCPAPRVSALDQALADIAALSAAPRFDRWQAAADDERARIDAELSGAEPVTLAGQVEAIKAALRVASR